MAEPGPEQHIDQLGVGLDHLTVDFAQMQKRRLIVKRTACSLLDKISKRRGDTCPLAKLRASSMNLYKRHQRSTGKFR
ncbi:hypothetical protein GGE65_002512 [Skermanella aerolata]|uniref:hypothetical protein n=1 Tax=Skermanella aerolata TaxID=393310 RepID=UPI003D1CCFCE